MFSRSLWLATAFLFACGLPAPSGSDPQPGSGGRGEPDGSGTPAGDAAAGLALPAFSTASVEESQTLNVPSDGDLWANCWADDDQVYTANGDGKGFGDTFDDIVVNRLTGSPETGLSGVALARGAAVSSIWTRPTNGITYNRKPTGMVCVDGALYLAVQDLATDFMDAPAATIVKSVDHGKTWTWNTAAPMFGQHQFTTLFFADFGKDNARAIDDYVYAYGLDGNWRFSTRVPSPTSLWLARVPRQHIQDRAAWTFFAGFDGNGAPTWTADLAQRRPVLDDPSTVYDKPIAPNVFATHMTRLSQGGVVYDAPLDRYLYTSWTEFTFEFYEAPRPWGPWKPFLSKDYGVYPWFVDKNGGYGTTVPSKFISADGKSMYVQSNTFSGGARNYGFSLRRLAVEPYLAQKPANPPSTTALPTRGVGAAMLSTSVHYGHDGYLDDGITTGQSDDSWNGDDNAVNLWGYAWPRAYDANAVVYTTGARFPDGGWFTDLRVQVRRNGLWSDATHLTISPAYPFDASTPANTSFTLRFDRVAADGVRLIGTPGGTARFTSIAELRVLNLP